MSFLSLWPLHIHYISFGIWELLSTTTWGIWTFWSFLFFIHFYCQRQSLALSCPVISTTVNSMTISGFCSASAWSAFGYKTEATYNHCTVWSGNLFLQPQLEFTKLNEHLSVKRFLRIETLTLLHQLTILLAAANINGKKTLSPLVTWTQITI